MNAKPASKPLPLAALSDDMRDAIRYYGSDLAIYPIGCPGPSTLVREALIAGGLLGQHWDLTPAGVEIYATIKSEGMSAALIEETLAPLKSIAGHAYAVRAQIVTDARGTDPVWTVEACDAASPDEAWHAIEQACEVLIDAGFSAVRIGFRVEVLCHKRAPAPFTQASRDRDRMRAKCPGLDVAMEGFNSMIDEYNASVAKGEGSNGKATMEEAFAKVGAALAGEGAN